MRFFNPQPWTEQEYSCIKCRDQKDIKAEEAFDAGLVARGLRVIAVDGSYPIHLHMLIFLWLHSLGAGMMNMEHSIECVVKSLFFPSPVVQHFCTN